MNLIIVNLYHFIHNNSDLIDFSLVNFNLKFIILNLVNFVNLVNLVDPVNLINLVNSDLFHFIF